jgi:hypothetical protein
MSQGKSIVANLGREGLVQNANVSDWSFLYIASTVKDPRFNVGDKVRTPDGRTFRYAKSGAACWTGRGNVFYNAIPATGIDYSLLYSAAAVGATSVQMTNQGTVAQTEDGLRGGFILLKPVTGSTDQVLQMRGIIGNTAGGISDVITIYLDAPVSAALTTASYAFCMPSPWSDIRYLENATAYNCSHAGVAAVNVTAASMYFWIQTWGLCWIAPQPECGATDYGREVVFRYDGSIQLRDYSSAQGGAYGQVAGFIVDNNTAANGATIIFLQIDP